jgi:hypothetical protein
MAKAYDLVVVGVGTAAMGVVGSVREAGWSAAVIDFRPYGAGRRDPREVAKQGAADGYDLSSLPDLVARLAI